MENNFFEYVKWIVAIIGGATSTLLGGWDTSMKILVLVMVADFISGISAALINKEFDSKIGFVGVTRKILTMLAIMVAYGIDVLTGVDILRNTAVWFYIGIECFSFAENIGKAGVLLPKALTDAFTQLKGYGDKDLKEVRKNE